MSMPQHVPGEDDVLDDVDRAILGDLARLYAATDPPPAGLVDRITFRLTLEGLHAEIAELQRGEELVARDDRPVESLTFAGSRTSLMVTITPGPLPDAPVRVDGWVTRGGTVVELVTAEEVLTQQADDRGRLVWEGVPRGMVHFVIRPDDPTEPATLTPRVEL